MGWENEQAVCRQMADAGLIIDGLRIGTEKAVRCKVDGEKGTKGWYWLSEFPLDDGAIIITGAFGIWHGSDNGHTAIMMPERICTECGTAMPRTKKICPNCKSKDLRAHEISKEDRAAMRKKLMDRKRDAEAALKRKQQRAAREAAQKWRAMQPEGASGYLERKQVKPFGVRFTADGALAVPMLDTSGSVHGLQFILDKSNDAHRARIKKMGTDKRFWPTGLAMTGHFCIIGAPDPSGIMLLTEGYATGASLHMATGLPVFVTFSANNILPVLLALEKYYNRAHFLICADDDYLCRCQHCKKQNVQADTECAHCKKPHGKINTGVTVAMKASMSVDRAAWIVPLFTDRTDAKTGKPLKLTDFNDLHCAESLQAVEAQISAAIADKFPATGKAQPPAREPRTGGAGKASPSFMGVDDACARYALVYGVKDTMFDSAMFKLVPKSCVLDITPDHAWRDMKRRADFRVVDIDQVGFDPTESDPNIVCNMWGGWPEIPGEVGRCDMLLDLLQYLCSSEKNSRELYRWVLRWLALPMQVPGAKMKTSIVFLGPTRVGKNLFFDTVVKIYGRYGFMIGQDALEDTFNDWLSGKLFLLANEVMARQDLYHNKNKLKTIITEDTVRIRAPFMGSRWEKNCANLVFLSNEDQPVAPDPDDERFLVIRTPKRRDKAYYRKVVDEINNGGVKALYEYLMAVDLGDFDIATHPPMTKAKKSLVDLSKDSVQRFYESWRDGELDLPLCDCLKGDLYEAYRRWCAVNGEKYPRTEIQFKVAVSKQDGITSTVKPIYAGFEKGLSKFAKPEDKKTKPARMYEMDMSDRDTADSIVFFRTKCVVNFSRALNGDPLIKDGDDDI